MSSDSEQDQADRPMISLSNTHPTEDLDKNTKSASLLASDFQEDQVIFDPLETQRRLQKYFVIALSAGSVCIFAFKSLGLWNIAACVGVMIVYGLYSRPFLKLSTAKSVFADSFYYLGFLFTFVALIATMAGLGAEDFSAQTIIGQIGPALATTVIGMAYRIYITQFDSITSEPETEVLSGLGELSSNLSSALSELQNLLREYSANSVEQQQELSNLVGTLSDQIKTLDFKPAVSSLQLFEDQVSKLTSNIVLLSESTKQIEDNADKLTITAQGTVRRLDIFNEDLDSIPSLKPKAEETFNSLTIVQDEAETASEGLRNFGQSELIERFNSLKSQTVQIEENLDSAQLRIEKFSQAIDGTESQLKTSLDSFGESAASLTKFDTKISEMKDLSSDLERTQAAVKGLGDGVNKLQHRIESELNTVGENTERSTKLAADLIQKQLSPLIVSIQNLEKELRPIEGNLRQIDMRVRKSITEVMNFLSK